MSSNSFIFEKKNHAAQAAGICALVAIFYCYEYYLRVAPSVMSEELMQAYQLSNAGLGILSACFYYAYMPTQIIVGITLDKIGPRIVLTIACLTCTIGTYLFCLTSSIISAQVGRFLIGFGSAFAFVGFLKICANWLPHRFYAMMTGLCMLLGMIGAMSGEISLSHWTNSIGWQTTLIYAAHAGLILSIILWFIVRNVPNQGPINQSNNSRSNYNLNIWPNILHILLNKQLWLAGIIGCFTFLPLSSFAEMWGVPYLISLGLSKADAAFGSSLVFFGFGLGAPLWGIFSDRIKSRKIPLAIGAFLAAASIAICIYFPYKPPLMLIYTTMFCCGFFSAAEILVFAIGNDQCNPDFSGTTVAFINMAVMLGGIILQPVIGQILDHYGVNNYQIALAILPIGLAFAGLCSLTLKDNYYARIT